jgi:hypothetical protein
MASLVSQHNDGQEEKKEEFSNKKREEKILRERQLQALHERCGISSQ